MPFYDPQIDYWASLCEEKSNEENNSKELAEVESSDEQVNLNEQFEEPFAYDTTEGYDPIVTVGDLKKALSYFKDNDTLAILGSGDREFTIKVLWNSEMEYEMTDNDAPDNMCFIRVD